MALVTDNKTNQARMATIDWLAGHQEARMALSTTTQDYDNMLIKVDDTKDGLTFKKIEDGYVVHGHPDFPNYPIGKIKRTPEHGWFITQVNVSGGRVPGGCWNTRSDCARQLLIADLTARLQTKLKQKAPHTLSIAQINKLMGYKAGSWYVTDIANIDDAGTATITLDSLDYGAEPRIIQMDAAGDIVHTS